MNCPRCGRAQPPDADGAFCVECGQFLVPMRWVASPPPGTESPPKRVSRGRYPGPPRYLSPPTWGFPALPWRRGESDDTETTSTDRLVSQAGLLVPLLRGLAVLAALSACGEAWRYVLLLRSRNEALGAAEVAASDALVGAASWVTTVLTLGAGAVLLSWVLGAVQISAEQNEVRPARTSRVIVWGWLIPGINLTIPGSVLSEIEHAALRRDPAKRPDPSKLITLWWALWASNVVVGIIATLWLLRTGTQARADGVVQHVFLDVLAAAAAVVTSRVVTYLTALIAPPRRIPLPRVVRVVPAQATSV
ncbi:MAG TPA: DUF4328 domain-containing protein [Pseudonocardia sp.]|nr:DUF4328 domain-containing protein [Pseudonocardia sp.]